MTKVYDNDFGDASVVRKLDAVKSPGFRTKTVSHCSYMQSWVPTQERERRTRTGIGLAMITKSLPTEEASGRATQRTERDSEDSQSSTLKGCIAKFGDETTFHGVRFVTDYKLHFLRR